MKKNKNHRTNNGSLLSETWRRLKRSRLALLGLIIMILLIFTAVFASFIAPYNPNEQDLMNALQSPSLEHIFGTDQFGRDIFSRVIYGSRISLQVGFLVVFMAAFIGGGLGAIAGYFSGHIENIIMRTMDILLSVPPVLLAITIVAALGNGLINLMIAIGISSIPRYTRIVRSSVISIKNEEFIEAAQVTGSSDLRIIIKHIIPNCLAPVIVQATLGMAYAILTTAGLSFLGLGIQPPTPEWGSMLSGGRSYIRDYSYMTLFPGLAIVVTIFGLNVLGDGLRDSLDPKLKD